MNALMRWLERANGGKPLAARERRLLGLATAVLVAALLWSFVVGPAWTRWRTAPLRLATAQAQWDELQRLAQRAARLQGATPANATPRRLAAEGVDAPSREALLASLGAGATVEVSASRITLRCDACSGAGLQDAMRLVRSRFSVRWLDADLRSGPQGWQGRLTWEWVDG